MIIEDEIYDAIFKNTIVFLNASIKSINNGLNDYANKVLAIVNLQMALELAIKSIIVSNYGVTTILENADQTEIDLKDMYYNNNLRVRNFDNLKNFVKAKRIYDFDKPEYMYMERFQNYRNKLVHFNYQFSNEEDSRIENDIIHVLVYILGVVMSDDTDVENRTIMQDYINMNEYRKLLRNNIYYDMITDMIDLECGEPYHCPLCDNKLLTSQKICFGCLVRFAYDPCYGFMECKYCGEEMVIYDKENISFNGNSLRGLCLRCLNDTMVYQCPKCGKAIDMEFPKDNECREDYCEMDN